MNQSLNRRAVGALMAAAMTALPLSLAGCDRDVSKSKVTTEKTTSTPEGVKKTTETTEKKVEVERKNP